MAGPWRSMPSNRLLLLWHCSRPALLSQLCPAPLLLPMIRSLGFMRRLFSPRFRKKILHLNGWGASWTWLTLWRDERGHFGSLASPVVDQDSPSAPIEGVEWDAPTRTLRFTSKPSINIEMTGVLTGARFRVTAVNPKWSPDQKLPILLFNNVKLRSDWRSRSQFECAMTMWRRR
jgi:hypothetical protein